MSITVRFVVGAFAMLAAVAPITVDDQLTRTAAVADDGGGTSSSDPPYSPDPSDGGSSSPSDEPGGPGGKDGENGDGGEGSSTAEAAAGLPVAAQAGISLGVLALAALALLPGRRPPAQLR